MPVSPLYAPLRAVHLHTRSRYVTYKQYECQPAHRAAPAEPQQQGEATRRALIAEGRRLFAERGYVAVGTEEIGVPRASRAARSTTTSTASSSSSER